VIQFTAIPKFRGLSLRSLHLLGKSLSYGLQTVRPTRINSSVLE